MRRATTTTAYLLWVLSFFGICGLQRFYVGQIGWGLLYLCTFGLFGIGQLLDLFFIPALVKTRNAHLRHLYQAELAEDLRPSLTADIAGVSVRSASLPPTKSVASPMHQVLQVAHEHGGQLSKAQVALHTGLEPAQVDEVLQEALRLGYAEVANHPETGAVRYVFDI